MQPAGHRGERAERRRNAGPGREQPRAGSRAPGQAPRDAPPFATRLTPSPAHTRLGLPRATHVYVVPVALSLAVFVILVVAKVYWGGIDPMPRLGDLAGQESVSAPRHGE